MLELNQLAPDFELLDQDSKKHKLSDLRNKFVVIYFYPKDNTPGCTQEACDFRDNMDKLSSENCIVFGISKDSLASHLQFRDKYNLNFNLLSDPDLTVHKKYQVLNEEEKVIRSTFLIDKNGKIIKIWSKVKVSDHVAEVVSNLDI